MKRNMISTYNDIALNLCNILKNVVLSSFTWCTHEFIQYGCSSKSSQIKDGKDLKFVWFHGLLYLRMQSIIWYSKRFFCIYNYCFEFILFTFTFNCGVRLSSGESILGGGVCDLSSVSNGSPSERSSPFLGLWKVDKGNKFITSRVLHISWNEWHLNFLNLVSTSLHACL